MTLTQGHSCDLDKQKVACLQDKVRTTQPITTKLCSYIPLVMLITWLDLNGILLETLFLSNFLLKFLMCFFKVKHTIGHISRMVGSIDVKRKGGASVRSWVNYVTLTFDPTHDLDLVVSRSKFEIALWGGGGWLPWNERGVSRSFMTMIVTCGYPWWDGWMYRILTGVTSDVGVLSTYLVFPGCHCPEGITKTKVSENFR